MIKTTADHKPVMTYHFRALVEHCRETQQKVALVIARARVTKGKNAMTRSTSAQTQIFRTHASTEAPAQTYRGPTPATVQARVTKGTNAMSRSTSAPTQIFRTTATKTRSAPTQMGVLIVSAHQGTMVTE